MLYKKILAPLDGSKVSECSLPHIKEIATGSGISEVILMMVVEPVFNQETEDTAKVGRNLMAEVEQANWEKDQKYLDGLAARLKKDGIPATAVLAKGKPAETIMDYAQKNKADLIIMSTHGRSGVSRWLLGSVTEKVVRHSPVPVLTVSPVERKAEGSAV
jgi:nucleotide-binding universal stress UspA family protein